MLRHRVIPTLLLKGDGLVKTTKFKYPVYIGDPINAVRIFNDKEVDELILLDITATPEKRDPNYDKIKDIVSEAFMPIGYGGGINNMQQIEKLFKIGIEKIIINHAAFNNIELIRAAANVYGSQSIVVAIDIKKKLKTKYTLFSNSGKSKHKISLENHLKLIQNAGCGEVFLNSINRDGMMGGYDLELIKMISARCEVPVIASGGAGSIQHFCDAIKMGASAVAAGAMFVFQGVHRAVLISYPKYDDLEKMLN